MEAALRFFYRAIELAPNFATPYGLAARCYQGRKTYGVVLDPAKDNVETKRLALRAAAIGQDDALALTWAGLSIVWVCREYDTGAALVDKATSVNPQLGNLLAKSRIRQHVARRALSGNFPTKSRLAPKPAGS